MKHSFPALVVAAACLLPAMPVAQGGPRTAQVYVTALDAKGVPVTDLTERDVKVSEDGVAREVVSVAPATEPLDIALLIDDSQAASQDTQMIRDGARDFVKALAGKGNISIVTYGERPTIAADSTPDEQRLLDVAGRIFPRPGSGTYFMDAIQEVCKGFAKRAAERPVIVALLIEDPHEFSNLSYLDVLKSLHDSGASLNVVALGPPLAGTSDEIRNRNQAIAMGTEQSGGAREQILAATGIPVALKKVADQTAHQYVVTYGRPERLIPPEKIQVTSTRPGVTIRARTRLAAR